MLVSCMWADADLSLPRNIVTYHAEDGSGVGSAIIAGELAHAACFYLLHLIMTSFPGMTKIRKDAGLYVNV
jgi:hypothetical protein